MNGDSDVENGFEDTEGKEKTGTNGEKPHHL